MIFTIKMHWKSFLLQKCIGNDLYYKNALEMIFYNKNTWEIIFIIKMHWEWFLP